MRADQPDPQRVGERTTVAPLTAAGVTGPTAWSFGVAGPDDAAAVAEVRTLAADELTREFGHGPWSSQATPEGVLRNMQTSRVLVARGPEGVVGTLRLATRKPWAIDAALFTPVQRPIYLTDMAVLPRFQRRGIGRRLLEEAAAVAHAWPGDAIRLDAYDAPAGAGDFYRKCDYREVGRGVYRGTPHIYFERLLRADA